MFKTPEEYRVKTGPFGSDRSYGCNGVFFIPHPRINNYTICCMVSDGMGWEHVSVTVSPNKNQATRFPTWEEMSIVKDHFWDDTDTVIQFHPPASEYINQHPYCLHLWRKQFFEMPLPDSITVGNKKVTI